MMKSRQPAARVEVSIGDRRVQMDSNEVVRKLQGVKPGRIKAHAVKVEGVYHPIKEAFSTVTGVDVADFNTHTARNAFKRLGFEVVRMSRN
jgi:hypothetical protein